MIIFGKRDWFGAPSPQTGHPGHRRLKLTENTRHENEATMHDWLVGAKGRGDRTRSEQPEQVGEQVEISMG